MRNFPLQVYINVTEKCNLKCIHCYSNSGYSKKQIDFNKLAKLLNKIKPLRIIISGGEPLLVWKKLEKFFNKLKFKPFCTILTNGTVFDDSIRAFLEKFADEVVISLDTTNKTKFEAIRKVDLLDIVLLNISKISKLNLKKRINYSIFSNNSSDLQKVINFMNKNGLENLCILRPRNIGRSNNLVSAKKVILIYKKAIQLAKKNKLNLTIHDPLVNQLGFKDLNTTCYAGEKILSIDCDFNFKPCPLVEKKFSGAFEKVWNSKEFVACSSKSSCILK